MLKNFNTFDRRILIAAALMLLLSSYFLYDDSLLMTWLAPHGIEVADLTLTQKSVRLKFASQSQFIDVKHGAIHKGDTLFTGPGAKAVIKLKNGKSVEISENSMIQFTSVGDQLIVNLLQGHAKSDSPGVEIVGDETTRKPSSEEAVVEPPRPVITSIKAFEHRKVRLTVDGVPATPTTLDLAWIYPKPEAEYEVQIAKDPGFDKVVFAEHTNETHLLTPQLKQGENYARVREKNTGHGAGLWSKTVMVEFQFEKPPVVDGFASPKVPGDELTFIIGGPNPNVLHWEASAGATNYVIEVDSTVDFTNSIKFKSPEPVYTLTNLTPGHFFYRISGVNDKNELSPPSAPGKFLALVRAPVPKSLASFVYSAKDSKDVPPAHSFTLAWQESPQTAHYAVLIANNPQGKDAKRFVTDSLTWTFKMSKPDKVFWQVQALDKNQHEISLASNPSTAHYVFNGPLDPPPQVEPLPDFTLYFQSSRDNPFWFTWQNVKAAESYRVQVAKDADFKNVLLDKASTQIRFLTRQKLPEGTLFWRVRAEASGDRVSPWSPARSLQIFAGRVPASERSGFP